MFMRFMAIVGKLRWNFSQNVVCNLSRDVQTYHRCSVKSDCFSSRNTANASGVRTVICIMLMPPAQYATNRTAMHKLSIVLCKAAIKPSKAS